MIPENNNADTNAELAALKSQLFTLLLALIVVSGTLTVYLYRQDSLVNKDIQQIQQVDANLARSENAIGEFVGKLWAYGQKHPEFLPVLKKYGVPSAKAPAAPSK
jgi:energy-converting hydrogenase Eha subunit F